MYQLLAIALGGSFGAVFRFLVSSGIYQWLGRDFPYGTLGVNILGSFLLGLLTEALVVQRIAIAFEYRSAILIGFIGAFTTFSTFSLETVYLIEQGSLTKAAGNIFVSVSTCILAIWLGLICSRALFSWSNGAISWNGQTIPYALMVVNAIGAFLIGFVIAVLLDKTGLIGVSNTSLFIVIGIYLISSGAYLVFFLIEQGYSFPTQWAYLLATFTGNALICLLVTWLGSVAGKEI